MKKYTVYTTAFKMCPKQRVTFGLCSTQGDFSMRRSFFTSDMGALVHLLSIRVRPPEDEAFQLRWLWQGRFLP